MKTKITSASVSKLKPKTKKCTHCDIFLYKIGQKLENRNITARVHYEEHLYNGQIKQYAKHRDILTDDIIGSELREPTIFNIEGNNGLCRMCELTRKGTDPEEVIKTITSELFNNYPVTIKQEAHEPYEVHIMDDFITFNDEE